MSSHLKCNLRNAGVFRQNPVVFLLLVLATLEMSGPAQADAVTDWNVTAVAVSADLGLGMPRSRVLAMTHAAIHDALNSIQPRYRTYAREAPSSPSASPEAAVAAAAHDVLIATVPSQVTALNAAYATALAAIADGIAKIQGIAAGQAAAATILALRANDGAADANIPYTLAPGLGIWQPTPPGFLPAAFPGWGNITPFVLHSDEQFRPALPQALDLTSTQFAADYNEVKQIGDVNSVTRTADQSSIAQFWYEGSPFTWDRIARVVSTQQGLDLWQNARLFALLNFAMADGFIAGFNAKYFYNFWRPVTAIENGANDNNPDTVGDPAWSSFLVTPNIPDFPSTHSILGAAAAAVLQDFFNSDFIAFTTTSGAPFPGITRSYTSFSQAVLENANSRVYAGIHFRTACTEGMRMGEKIGKFTFMHVLEPLDNDGRNH